MRFRNKKEILKTIIIKKFAFLPTRLPSGDLIWLEFYKVKGYWFLEPASGRILFNDQKIIE